MRCASLIALALVATPALATPFPEPSDRWLLDVRSPQAGGSAEFGRWDATPAPGSSWNLRVTCGMVDRSGRETVLFRGRGAAIRDPRGRMVAVWDGPPGVTEKPGFFWSLGEDDLHPRVNVRGLAPCPGGPGELSTGD